MALTVHSSPAAFTPSDNPITWVFSSDQTAQANFSYFITVKVNAINVSTHTVYPEVGIRAHFDASADAKAYTDPSFIGQTAFNDNANNNVEIQIQIQESYGSPPTLQASTTTSNVVAFKARINNVDFQNWDYTTYSSVSGTKFMTDFPSADRFYLADDEEAFISLICDRNGVTATVTLYDIGNNQIALANNTDADAYIQMLNVSQTAIIADTAITQNDFDNSAYYTVEITDTSSGSNTVSFTVWIDRAVSSYPRYRLFFLNRLGAIDSYTFTRVSNVLGDVTRQIQQKQFGQWNGTAFEYSASQGQKRIYHSYSMPRLILNSDWLSEDQQAWLTGLYNSVLLWVYDGTTTELALIMTSSFEKKQHLNQFLVNEQIELEMSRIDESIVI